MSYLGELVNGENIKKELGRRSKTALEASVSKKKVPHWESQGWAVVKENKNTTRIKLPKPISELVEDQVWCLMAKLGFNELSKGREFKVNVGDVDDQRQIDIFAKDDESALIIECSSAEVPGTVKRMTGLIDKIRGFREGGHRSIQQHYGRGAQLKVGWVIATRNIKWAKSDLDRAEELGISILRDEEIDYFTNLSKHLGHAARYQLLAHIFAGVKIRGLELKVPATRGRMAGDYFYNFLISPAQLLKIAYIGHKGMDGSRTLKTYQRMLKPSRLKEIAKYVDDGGRFPTNVVINLENDKDLRFEKQKEIGECAFGELYLPTKYASAWVIDGQHRLYGFSLSQRADESTIPVLAFQKLPPQEQKRLFIDINHKQVKVSKGLLIDLYSELHADSPNPEQRMIATTSQIVKRLNSDSASPICGRVAIGEEAKNSFKCLNLASLSDAILNQGLVGYVRDELIMPGALSGKDFEATLDRACDFLSLFFGLFRENMPSNWELGDGPGGYLCTNNAMIAMLRVLRAVLHHIEKTEQLDTESILVEDLIKKIKPFFEPLLNYFTMASPETLQQFRAQVGSKGQRTQSMAMMTSIHEALPEFNPSGLKEYIDSWDKQGTKEAAEIIRNLQALLYKAVIELLKRHYGSNEDEWWVKGIPQKVRTECAVRQESDPDRKQHKHQYLDLIDYRKIAMEKTNWSPIFQKYLSVGDKSGSKEKQLDWIVKLNPIRNTVSHPERGLISKEDAEFVRETHIQLTRQLSDFK